MFFRQVFQQSYQRRYACSGQALVEHLMIGGAVAVVSIGAFMTVGANFAGFLNGVLADMQGQTTLASSGNMPGSNGTGTPGDSLSGGGTSESAFKMVLPSGREIILPEMPDNIQTSLQTAGANGATKVLNANIRAIAEQLLESGEITPEQANTLIQLANAGNKIADIEKLVEDGLNSCPTRECYQNLQIEYEGTMYPPIKLSNMIGFRDDAMYEYNGNFYTPNQLVALLGTDAAQPILEANGYMPILKDFMIAREQAIASGAMDDPVIKLTIDFLVKEIAQIGTGVEGASWYITNKNQTNQPQDFKDLVLSLMNGYSAATNISPYDSVPDFKDGVAKITYDDAGDICNLGGGTCPP